MTEHERIIELTKALNDIKCSLPKDFYDSFMHSSSAYEVYKNIFKICQDVLEAKKD